MMKPADLYHAGIVVDDFDATLARFSAAHGYRWCEPVAIDQLISTSAGEQSLPMRIVYTVDEPRIEILQTIPGTIWTPADSGIHHLGYWSDDVDADVVALLATGMQLEATTPLDDGSPLFAYCHAPGRVRVELVNRVMEPMMSEWFNQPAASLT
jgi:Glyoxalase/Bleomycin resistance protein/Dioxygenase superfamily